MHSDGTGNGNLTAAFVSESNTEKTAKPTSESQTAASAVGAFANVQMNGQEVFKFAVRAVPDTLAKSLAKAGVSAEEIDHLVLHQANQRIIDGAARLGPAEKVVSHRKIRTPRGSVPRLLRRWRSGPAGGRRPAAGFGAGLTWASAIFRW